MHYRWVYWAPLIVVYRAELDSCEKFWDQTGKFLCSDLHVNDLQSPGCLLSYAKQRRKGWFMLQIILQFKLQNVWNRNSKFAMTYNYLNISNLIIIIIIGFHIFMWTTGWICRSDIRLSWVLLCVYIEKIGKISVHVWDFSGLYIYFCSQNSLLKCSASIWMWA